MKKKQLFYSSVAILLSSLYPNIESHFDIVHWGASERQGRRNYMEDFHIITHHEDNSEIPQKPNFFGLYDGHGGSYVSEELKDTLHQEYYNACHNKQLSKKEALAKALSEIETSLRPENGEIDDPVNQAGSTAIVATLDGNKLYLANVGDSRAVVVRNGKIVFSTGDHKPHHVKELHRLYASGYTLDSSYSHTPRVKGFSLSRTIGDWNTKIHYPRSLVATPDLYEFKLEPKDILIMASDGLWDVMTNEELASGLPKLIEEHNKEAAREDSITERKYDDDISVTERKEDDDILDQAELSKSTHFQATKDKNHEKTYGNRSTMRTVARTLRDYAHDARKSGDNITIIAVQFDKIPEPKTQRKKVDIDNTLNLIIQNAQQLQKAIQNKEKNGLVGVLFNNLKEIIYALAPEIIDYLANEQSN